MSTCTHSHLTLDREAKKKKKYTGEKAAALTNGAREMNPCEAE